jgi:hypothetical protein
MSQIEEIAEYHEGDKVWRTTCKCMGDDHLTFTVATDDETPEVYLEFYVEVGDSYYGWTEKTPFRYFKSMWKRIKLCMEIFWLGRMTANGAFLFRGEEQIDAVTEAIQEHKKYMIERRKTADWKETEAGHWVRNEETE